MTAAQQEQARSAPTTPTTTTASRGLAALAAMIGAATTWGVVEGIFRPGLVGRAFEDGGSPEPIGLGPVIVSTGVAAMLGWAPLAGSEPRTARPRTIWIARAVVVPGLSFVPPLSGSGVDGRDRALLILLHVVVAAITIPLLSRMATSQRKA